MPAILTHDLFGKDAFGPALGAIDLYTPDERDAFLLGNQGPDPLFYLKLVPPLVDFERMGTDLHREAPTRLLVSMRKSVDAMDEGPRRVARAYLAGFVCHYLLDRAAHPFIDFWERGICEAGVEGLDLSDHNMVHAEVERDLDEMMLYAKRNQTIKTYRPYREVLRIRDDALDVIGRLYFEAQMVPSGETEPTLSLIFPLAVRCYRVVESALWTPTGVRSRVLGAFEKPIMHSRYSLGVALSHRVRAEAISDFDNRDHLPWKNPFTGVVQNTSFIDIYDEALSQVADAIGCVLADDFDESRSAALTGGLNFSGERVG